MSKQSLPKSDSIEELAQFWDTHDVTEFEDELEEVIEPVFEGGQTLHVPLDQQEAAAIEKLAESRGMSPADLVRSWIRERNRAAS